MAPKKTAAPALAYCPFCKDGGQPFFKKTSAFDSCGCKACGVTFEGPGCVEKWNTRFFLTAPEKMAAYNALINVAAMRQLWIAAVATTISKKKLTEARNAFISATVIFLEEHGGIVRSALNEMETAEPPKKKGRESKK